MLGGTNAASSSGTVGAGKAQLSGVIRPCVQLVEAVSIGQLGKSLSDHLLHKLLGQLVREEEAFVGVQPSTSPATPP